MEAEGETFEYPVSEEEADVAASVYHIPGDGDDFKELCGGLVAQENKQTNKETTPSAGKFVNHAGKSKV